MQISRDLLLGGGELSDFRAICCEIGGFHFSVFKLKNGRRILRNLPKWGAVLKTLGGDTRIFGKLIARMARILGYILKHKNNVISKFTMMVSATTVCHPNPALRTVCT